jgi:hypothetical protein
MAWQRLQGSGLMIPGPCPSYANPSFNSLLVIDATGEKAAFCGRVWNKDRASKTITRVGFRFGAVTKAGGSGLTVSLQDVSLVSGPPMQPDGAQDQTVAIANSDPGFTSNVWYRTNALSANRTVAFGELLALVVEYDASGRLGSDSVVISGIYRSNVGEPEQSVSVLYTTSWATQSTAVVNCILEFTDGTFGTLYGGSPASNLGYAYFNSGSDPDEVALHFKFPFPVKVDACWTYGSPGTSAADYDVVLYEGTTPMNGGTISIDANAVSTTQLHPCVLPFASEISLAKDTDYYLAIKPTQAAASVYQAWFEVADANHLAACEGGTEFHYAYRVDGGAWNNTLTARRPFMGLFVSSVDDGVGGGAGGLLVHPGMSGGMRG